VLHSREPWQESMNFVDPGILMNSLMRLSKNQKRGKSIDRKHFRIVDEVDELEYAADVFCQAYVPEALEGYGNPILEDEMDPPL